MPLMNLRQGTIDTMLSLLRESIAGLKDFANFCEETGDPIIGDELHDHEMDIALYNEALDDLLQEQQ